MGHVAGAGCRAGGAAELVRPVLSTALFAHAVSEQDTAVFAATAAADLVPAVVRQLRELLAGLVVPGPGEVEVAASRAEPGLVLVTAGSGQLLGVQVVDHAELLVRDRVETLAARNRSRTAGTPPGTCCSPGTSPTTGPASGCRACRPASPGTATSSWHRSTAPASCGCGRPTSTSSPPGSP
jgi:hypothetical protein